MAFALLEIDKTDSLYTASQTASSTTTTTLAPRRDSTSSAGCGDHRAWHVLRFAASVQPQFLRCALFFRWVLSLVEQVSGDLDDGECFGESHVTCASSLEASIWSNSA